MQEPITPELWQAWRQHPVTQMLLELLHRRQDELKEQWAAGLYTDQGQFGTAILNAKAIGNCEAYENVEKLEFEDFEELKRDDK